MEQKIFNELEIAIKIASRLLDDGTVLAVPVASCANAVPAIREMARKSVDLTNSDLIDRIY